MTDSVDKAAVYVIAAMVGILAGFGILIANHELDLWMRNHTYAECWPETGCTFKFTWNDAGYNQVIWHEKGENMS